MGEHSRYFEKERYENEQVHFHLQSGRWHKSDF